MTPQQRATFDVGFAKVAKSREVRSRCGEYARKRFPTWGKRPVTIKAENRLAHPFCAFVFATVSVNLHHLAFAGHVKTPVAHLLPDWYPE
ncbi:hypothetical protein D9M68_936760 [compost metagenome]